MFTDRAVEISLECDVNLDNEDADIISTLEFQLLKSENHLLNRLPSRACEEGEKVGFK